jgi:hypothetical protein
VEGFQLPLTRRAWLSAIPLSPFLNGRPDQSLAARLEAAIGGMGIFDSHEHLRDEKQRLAGPTGFFALVDLPGMDGSLRQRIKNEQVPESERWRAFAPFWQVAQFSGHGQALTIAVQDIYGVETISSATIATISERVRALHKPGLYDYVLKQRARIGKCVQDDYWNVEPVRWDSGLYVLARRFDRFVTPGTPDDIKALEKLSEAPISDLKSLELAMEKNFERNLGIGMKTVKVGLAYQRSLHFEATATDDAGRDLARLLKGREAPPPGFLRAVERPFRRLEDYMFHHLIAIIEAHGIPVQIHTGLGPALIANANPVLLANVFARYPRVRFDIFHMSYPYQGELASLAKTFSNVYADFCWGYMISSAAARRALEDFLDIVPVNRIIGFGGDCGIAELAYAHSVMARRAVAQVLALKVESRAFSEDQAVALAQRLLHDNGTGLFGVGKIDNSK